MDHPISLWRLLSLYGAPYISMEHPIALWSTLRATSCSSQCITGGAGGTPYPGGAVQGHQGHSAAHGRSAGPR